MIIYKIVSKEVSIIFAIVFITLFMVVVAKAFDDATTKALSADDLWTVDHELTSSFGLYEYLNTEGFLMDGLTFNEFDYICVLTQQLCTMTNNVDPSLVMAIIAVESNFNSNLKTGNTYGLMQLIPKYHKSRMASFVENDHTITNQDFLNPRLNIMVGIDYMDYLLSETDGDVVYALMWYNQGPLSASKDYIDNFKVSSYAKKITSLAESISDFLR